MPGITLGGAEGGQIGNNINLNGFAARTDIYLDGFRDRGQYYRDTFALDAVEVLNYEGGELQVQDQYGSHSVKLAAGDLVVYPATSLHQVTPVTRGVRLACFFWVQSLVREDGQRRLLFDLDNAIQRLNQTAADEGARRTLVGCYHNLMRQWSDT